MTAASCGGAPEAVEDLAIALFELVEGQDGVRGASASFAWDEDEWVVTLRVAVESAS